MSHRHAVSSRCRDLPRVQQAYRLLLRLLFTLPKPGRDIIYIRGHPTRGARTSHIFVFSNRIMYHYMSVFCLPACLPKKFTHSLTQLTAPSSNSTLLTTHRRQREVLCVCVCARVMEIFFIFLKTLPKIASFPHARAR